jgi:DNA polymerase
MMYGSVPEVLKKCIRSVLCASPGKVLLACDFAAIEARIQAWLTDSKDVLAVFRGDGKIYEHLAAQVYHVPKESIAKKSKERQIGKIIGLALQYQGALGAFRSFMKSTGFTGDLPDEEILGIIKKWRAANPNVVSYWYGLERAFKQAVRTKQVQTFRGLKIASTGTCARVYLPNGAPLSFWYPQVTPDGKLAYYGRLDGSTAWSKIDTYGGKLFENVVQAIGRELLADAMIEIDRRYPGTIVMHVHDEPVLEVDGDRGEEILADVVKIMSTPPEWGRTLPMAASGDVLFRYKK